MPLNSRNSRLLSPSKAAAGTSCTALDISALNMRNLQLLSYSQSPSRTRRPETCLKLHRPHTATVSSSGSMGCGSGSGFFATAQVFELSSS